MDRRVKKKRGEVEMERCSVVPCISCGRFFPEGEIGRARAESRTDAKRIEKVNTASNRADRVLY
jgi:hypothetical protein